MAEIRQDIQANALGNDRGIKHGSGGSKQEQLEDWCRQNQIRPPVYSIVSDRRGESGSSHY